MPYIHKYKSVYGYVHKPPRKKRHIIILPPYPFRGRPYPCRVPEIKNCQTRSLSTNLWDRSGTYKPNHCNMMCVGADLYLTGSARHLPAAENKIPLMPPFLMGVPCINSAIRMSPPVPVPGNPQRGPRAPNGTRTRAAGVCTPALWVLQGSPGLVERRDLVMTGVSARAGAPPVPVPRAPKRTNLSQSDLIYGGHIKENLIKVNQPY